MAKVLYDRLGRENVVKLVDRFYERVIQHKDIKDLFVNDIEEIKRKQLAFLTQFLGGPLNYSNEFGHPRMKMRHLPHRIGPAEKNAWLECMKQAIDSLHLEKDLGDELYNCFPKVANHMVNQ